jgi:hypothetical protein
MSSRRFAKGRISGPFVPLLKDTMKSEAWKASSHGARSLYVLLKARYNSKLQNHVYLSTRDAAEELGSNSHRDKVRLWFHELEHYGFIRMVSPAHHGVNGHGKAPHWRLTEEGYLGKQPTRDYLNWDGVLFEPEKRKPRPERLAALVEQKSRGRDARSSLADTPGPLADDLVPIVPESGPDAQAMSETIGRPHAQAITSQPLADDLDVLSAYAAMWTAPNAVPLKGLGLRRLFLPPAKRPDDLAVAKYFARWYAEPKKLAA